MPEEPLDVGGLLKPGRDYFDCGTVVSKSGRTTHRFFLIVDHHRDSINAIRGELAKIADTPNANLNAEKFKKLSEDVLKFRTEITQLCASLRDKPIVPMFD